MTREELKELSRVEPNYFEAGAKWVNSNPNLLSPWHQASEEPVGRDWRIMCRDEKGDYWVEDGTDAMQSHNTWDEYAAVKMIVKWAYFDELLKE